MEGEYIILHRQKEPSREEKARDILAKLARTRRDHPGEVFELSYNGEVVDEDQLTREVRKAFPDFETPIA